MFSLAVQDDTLIARVRSPWDCARVLRELPEAAGKLLKAFAAQAEGANRGNLRFHIILNSQVSQSRPFSLDSAAPLTGTRLAELSPPIHRPYHLPPPPPIRRVETVSASVCAGGDLLQEAPKAAPDVGRPSNPATPQPPSSPLFRTLSASAGSSFPFQKQPAPKSHPCFTLPASPDSLIKHGSPENEQPLISASTSWATARDVASPTPAFPPPFAGRIDFPGVSSVSLSPDVLGSEFPDDFFLVIAGLLSRENRAKGREGEIGWYRLSARGFLDWKRREEIAKVVSHLILSPCREARLLICHADLPSLPDPQPLPHSGIPKRGDDNSPSM